MGYGTDGTADTEKSRAQTPTGQRGKAGSKSPAKPKPPGKAKSPRPTKK